jgi:hypothetical protein
MSKMSRDKGARIEREIVNLHTVLGVRAERVPLSGASHYQGNGHDIDVYALGPDKAPLVCEVKARQDGGGFKMIETWLGDYDALFLRSDRHPPFVVVPLRTWELLIYRGK